MPRMPADPVGRLAVLEAARKRVRRGLIVNAAELAKVAGMTWRNLKLSIDTDPGFPVKQRGDMGVSWQFDAAAVLDHLMKQARAAQAERGRRTARVSRLAGLGEKAGASSLSDQPGTGAGTAAEMLADARAIVAVVDATARVRSEKQAQGRLVDAEAVRGVLWEVLTTMQAETLAVTAKMDPAGQWPATLRAEVEEELRNVLLAVRGKLEAGLEKLRGSGR